MVREARSLIAKANEKQKSQAEVYGADLLARSAASGVTASLDIDQEEYGRMSARIAHLARFADIAILEADAGNVSLHQGVLEEVLFESGRPIIVVPPTWSG